MACSLQQTKDTAATTKLPPRHTFDFFLIVSLISAKTTSDRNDAVDGRHDAVFAVAVGPARYGEGNHSSELLLVLVVVCGLLETQKDLSAYARTYSLIHIYPPLSFVKAHTTSASGPKIRGCIGPLYGTINWNAVAGWVAYHERRWGLDHVDVFVQEGDFEKSVQDHLEEVPVEFEASVNVTALPNTGQPYEHQIWLMNQCLENAKEADFMFNFDADEYLVSDDYETLSELFEFTNRPGVSFPIFPNNYHQCSAHAPTYGSATYQSVVPLGAEPDGQGSYTNPPPGVLAHRKYVVRPQHFQELESVHDPFGLYARPQGFEGLEHGGNDEDMYYMTGKSEMGHHARVVHMRTDVGIQADDTEILCQITPTCTYVTQDAKCIKNVNQAMYVNKKTSLNEILADLPLTKEAMNLFRESVCYAKRYPNLYSGFCGDDDSACHYEGLSKHYQETGKPSNMIWGCMERPTTFATPVVPSIFGEIPNVISQSIAKEATLYSL